MKTFILVALLLIGGTVSAQSLKEILYSGKLRSDTGTVIRKGEDLSTKIDTTTRKPVQPEVAASTQAGMDSMMTAMGADLDSTVSASGGKILPASAARDNNQLWKDYVDSLTLSLQSEVLPNKKIKEGSYSVLIDYVIETDGTITVNSISSSPGNKYLEEQIHSRLSLTAPTMTPLLNAYGKPRKAPKKQMILLNK